MVGKKGRSGPKKSLTRQVNEAMELIDAKLPDIVAKLIKKAEEGDRDALVYLIDRRLGKPKASLDVEGGQELGAGLVVRLFQILQEKQRELESRETKLLDKGAQ